MQRLAAYSVHILSAVEGPGGGGGGGEGGLSSPRDRLSGASLLPRDEGGVSCTGGSLESLGADSG